MSLRLRLTLLYLSLVGGILLLFGTAIYTAVSNTMVEQADAALEKVTREKILPLVGIGNSGRPAASLNELPPSIEAFWQIWSRNETLILNNTNIKGPLDPEGLKSNQPIFSHAYIGNIHLRVLTIPLETSGRKIGTLQVGTDITLLDKTQETLLKLLAVGTLVAIIVSGLAAWASTNRAFSPLKDATQAALQITKADDLSRRIPYQGPERDEIGQLVMAFNQTLGRLENLFHTQRRFMADVGHELRTPLTVIKGNVGLMRRMGADEESLSGIESEVDRLTRLVGDLLLLAQAESGKLPLDHRLVELDTLLLEAMQQMRILAGDKLQLRIGDIDQVLVCGDGDRLKQVLVNLIGNAIGYTPPGGEVVVSVGKVGNQARLVVSDTGPGIPADDLAHIFERFYRGQKSRTRTRDGKGFGLGLSIAYWIVRHHDGRIEVDSAEGKGTTFCMWLPLAQGECQG